MRNTVPFSSKDQTGRCGWISIEDVPDIVLVNPSVVIDRSKKIKIRFEYPLTNPVIIECLRSTVWTRKDFLESVRFGYQMIYDKEEQTSKVRVSQAGCLYNRNQTSGEYGIYGHELGDLALAGATKKDGIWELDVLS